MARSGGARLVCLALLSAIQLLALSEARAAPPTFDPAAAERLERRSAARQGRLLLPLPGTPDTQTLLTRLTASGITLGSRMIIRVFKAESELEVWFEKDGVFVPFATYPICFWSGTLGPKLREGDRQAPEGFYTITEHQLHHGDRWRRSLDIGYPNVFDRVNGRNGSLILVHGGCDSIGCFAMTNAVNAELYELVSATLRGGATHVHVHVFPFRMTDANITVNATSQWKDFWADLKQGYDSFERTHLPPHVSVCGKRYHIEDAMRGGRDAEGIELCDQDRDLIPDHLQLPDKSPGTQASETPPPCSTALASCRRWVALRDRRDAASLVATHAHKTSKVR